MGTAFGIFLFILVYAPVAYMVYQDVTGRHVRIGSRLALAVRHQSARPRPHLASRYQ